MTTDDKEPTKFICDGNCRMFQGFHICSHVVAAAHHNEQLELFLQYKPSALIVSQLFPSKVYRRVQEEREEYQSESVQRR